MVSAKPKRRPLHPLQHLPRNASVKAAAANVMAASIAYLGYSVITRPLAIPLAIVLWLGAAAMFFLGVWGRLPPATDPHDGRIRP